MRTPTVKKRRYQSGASAVEFALVAIIFFTFVFGTLELARIEYLMNTLREVTRRAASTASNVNFRDARALEHLQAGAVFRDDAGSLMLGAPVTSQNVMIDYLSVAETTLELKHMTTLPANPARNRWNCVTNPYGDNCIRFVRARVCASMDDAGNCQPMSYQMVFPFLDLSKMHLPIAETIVPGGSLGYSVGAYPSP
jgi:Flp pilus assembly protein TadG